MLHDIASSATVNLSLTTNATSLSNNVSVAKQYKVSCTCVCMTSLYNMRRGCSSPLSPPLATPLPYLQQTKPIHMCTHTCINRPYHIRTITWMRYIIVQYQCPLLFSTLCSYFAATIPYQISTIHFSPVLLLSPPCNITPPTHPHIHPVLLPHSHYIHNTQLLLCLVLF